MTKIRIFIWIIFLIFQLSCAQYVTDLQNADLPSGAWKDIACSDSGQQIIAVAFNGGVYLSKNYGYTWTNTSAKSPLSTWYSVASSGSGQYLFAANNVGGIYVSQNYGTTWTPTNAAILEWQSLCTSESGQYVYGVGVPGYFAVSSNHGIKWTNLTAPGQLLLSVTCSASGALVAVAVDGGSIVTSTNFGQNFTNSTSGVRAWYTIACNSSGEFLVAAAEQGSVYISSDFGLVWLSSGLPNYDWSGVGVSASGQYVYATAQNHPLYYSSDYGVTWSAASLSKDWTSVTCSKSGQYVYTTSAAGVFANYYTPTSQPSSSPSNMPSALPSGSPTSAPTFYSEYSYDLSLRYGAQFEYFSMDMSTTGNVLFVGASTRGVLYSTDYGNSWNWNQNQFAQSVACSSNGSVAYVGYAFVYSSFDFGASWQLTSLVEDLYNGLATSETGIHVYAAGVQGFYFSHSFGDSWVEAEVNSSSGFAAVACSKSGQFVSVLSSEGVLHTSSNFGLNFTTYNSTRFADARTVALSYSGQTQMICCEDVQGQVYVSQNYGVNWVLQPTPLRDCSTIALDESGQIAFASLRANGVYYSNNFGRNWEAITGSDDGQWTEVAASSNAEFLTALSFGVGIYTNQYMVPSSVPTSQPSPISRRPFSSYPTSQPSGQPSSSPSNQPSSFPTYVPDTFVDTVTITSSKAAMSYTFTNLGCGSEVFVWVTILVSYLDAASNGAISVTANSNVGSMEVVGNCAPTGLCDSVECVANVNVTSILSCSYGGSFTLSSTTVNVNQFTGVDTRCTFNGTSGLQYALEYSIAAYPLPTANPTTAPTVISGDFVFQASPDTPFYIISAVALLFVAMGVFVVRLRDQAKGEFSEMKLVTTCVDLGLKGYHLTAEVFYIVVVYTDQLHGLASGIIVIRLFSIVPGLYYMLCLFGPAAVSSQYKDKLNKHHFFKNASIYSLITICILFDQSMVRYLPWSNCEYSRESRGFPDAHILKVCMTTKLVQLTGAFCIQIAVLVGSNLEKSDKIGLALVFLYLCSSVGSIVVFVATNGIRFQMSSEFAKEHGEDATTGDVSNPAGMIESEEPGTELVELKDISVSGYKQRIAALEEKEKLLTSEMSGQAKQMKEQAALIRGLTEEQEKLRTLMAKLGDQV